MSKIVSLGSALQDIYLVDHDDLVSDESEKNPLYKNLVVGTKVDIDKIVYTVGGGGINAAVEFARHGHETTFLGNIGRDIAGDAVLAELSNEGIDSSFVTVSKRRPTGTSVIMLDKKSGERTILTARGASSDFSNLDPDCLDVIKPDWLFITSLRGDFETLEKFLKKTHENSIPVMLSPGKRELENRKVLTNLLKYVKIIVLNRREAKMLIPGENLEELAQRLHNLVETVIITDGQMGGIAVDPENAYRFSLYEQTTAKDATGAGDSFGSGFLAHLAAGYSFEESLIYGSANSTSVVAKIGAHTAALTGREELHPMPIQKLN